MSNSKTNLSNRSEALSLIEPMLIPSGNRERESLVDLALELSSKSSAFSASLPEAIRASISELVRAMNCYYSNLIEGHDTHPIDIERALNSDYSDHQGKRNLQLEAVAHIAVQKWIDEGHLSGRSMSVKSIREIHHRFSEQLPDAMLRSRKPGSTEDVLIVPGEFRSQDVQVGRHIPISPETISKFMDRFESVYSGLGKTETIIATAAAHHRFLWIHPFLDGNGRVARLMSYATLFDAIETGGLWSIARGLARNVESYKNHLAACDLPRRNDLDGRGNLSEEALLDFTRFFLQICIDQITFMQKLLEPDRLRGRVLLWAREEVALENLNPKTPAILEAILYRGELARGEVAAITGTTPRQGRRIISELFDLGILKSESSRAPLHLAFPATLAGRWLPGLFPE